MSLSNNFPAIKPSLMLDFANTGSLDPRVTFSRASTGTYYDGVTTAKAEQNLLLRSQEFDNAAWSKNRASITQNATVSPAGSTTADTLVEDGTDGQHFVTQSVTLTAAPYSVTCYFKAKERSVGIISFSSFRVNFDLDAEAVTVSSGGPTSTSIVSVGDGWYRCSVVGTPTAGATPITLSMAAAPTGWGYPGDGTSGIYVWGAQLEQRSAVTAYTATTTQPITNYIPVLQTAAANVARFDHTPTTGEALGLLVEEQRTNLVTYSEQFNSWSSSSSITANTNIAPDGTLTADTHINPVNSFYPYESVVIPAGICSFSIFINNASTAEWCRWRVNTATGSASLWFNFSTKTFGTFFPGFSGGAIVDVGGGWYRVSVQYTPAAGDEGARNWAVPCPVTGDNISVVSADKSLIIWGAQVEAGAFPTSYIATTSAQVTRIADAASMTGTNFSSWFNNAEGTVYAEAAVTSIVGPSGFWAVGDASLGFSTRNSIYSLSSTGTGLWAVSQAVNGVAQLGASALTGSFVANTPRKIAFAFKTNDTVGASNGAIGTVDTACLVPVSSSLSIGSLNSGWANGGNYLNGHISKLAYYPSRLTNAQLQALTS